MSEEEGVGREQSVCLPSSWQGREARQANGFLCCLNACLTPAACLMMFCWEAEADVLLSPRAVNRTRCSVASSCEQNRTKTPSELVGKVVAHGVWEQDGLPNRPVYFRKRSRTLSFRFKSKMA